MSQITDDHHMPGVEAMVAGTLALMTGYSQLLQAATNPAQRLRMGDKISNNLALLAAHPHLSPDFRNVLNQLRERWDVMGSCTAQAQPGPQSTNNACTVPGARPSAEGGDKHFTVVAPRTLQ